MVRVKERGECRTPHILGRLTLHEVHDLSSVHAKPHEPPARTRSVPAVHAVELRPSLRRSPILL